MLTQTLYLNSRPSYFQNGGSDTMKTETSDQYTKKSTDRVAKSSNLRGKTQMEFNRELSLLSHI